MAVQVAFPIRPEKPRKFHLLSFYVPINRLLSMYYKIQFESRFPLRTPRRNAGRFCLGAFRFSDADVSHSAGRGCRVHSCCVHGQWLLWVHSCTLLSGNRLQPGFCRSSVHMLEPKVRSVCTQKQRTRVVSYPPHHSWCISLFLFGQLTYIYTDKSKITLYNGS